jgi:DNA-binding transcriptional regulator YdaS (Cro superfamily)
MKRNSTTLFLQSPNAITPITWINNEPDFSNFTEPTLSVLQKAWQDFLDSGDELQIIPDPEPYTELPTPNWDKFNSQMLTDSEFNQMYNTANSLAPVVCASLPAALTQVSNGQLSMFNVIWNQIMQLGNATVEMRSKWGNWARDNNLPPEFTRIIEPSN